jgi:glycerol-3-phosphate dehydrogenase subunit C
MNQKETAVKTSNLSTKAGQTTNSPATILRDVLNACADCDTCRFMVENCLFFSELFRLYDKEKETGNKASDEELVNMASLCTLCGQCPCPNIPADIIRGKTEYVRRNGLPFTIRMLADVQRFGKMCSWFPALANITLSNFFFNRIVKKITGIHSSCQLPRIPKENFFSWAEKKGLRRIPGKVSGAVYFAAVLQATSFLR